MTGILTEPSAVTRRQPDVLAIANRRSDRVLARISRRLPFVGHRRSQRVLVMPVERRGAMTPPHLL